MVNVVVLKCHMTGYSTKTVRLVAKNMINILPCNKSGSVATRRQTSVNKVAVRLALTLLCQIEGNPPLGQGRHNKWGYTIQGHPKAKRSCLKSLGEAQPVKAGRSTQQMTSSSGYISVAISAWNSVRHRSNDCPDPL